MTLPTILKDTTICVFGACGLSFASLSGFLPDILENVLASVLIVSVVVAWKINKDVENGKSPQFIGITLLHIFAASFIGTLISENFALAESLARHNEIALNCLISCVIVSYNIWIPMFQGSLKPMLAHLLSWVGEKASDLGKSWKDKE